MKKHPEHQYLDLLQDILDNGVRKVDRGTGDASHSVFGRQMRFDLSEGFPLLTTKKVYWKGVLYELFWFLKGMSNIKYLLDHNVHIWDDYPYKIYGESLAQKDNKSKALSKDEFIAKLTRDESFAQKWGELPKIYGELWRRWPTRTGRTIDQLKWLISEVREDPGAHNLIVNSWNPEYLYTMAEKKDASRFPICHNMFQVNILNGKVCLQLYQRSADLFLGVPFNIASYALLTLLLAKVLGKEPGEFVHTFGDVHIYEIHMNQVKEQLARTPRPFPKVSVRRETDDIDGFEPEDIELADYNPHPPIKAELSVSGGYFQKKQE
jgi:thymidylate synthase